MRAEETTTSRGPRIFALDYVRAAAVIAVAVTHAVPASLDVQPTTNAMFVFAVTAFHVPSFLFVSGFLSASAVPTVAWLASRLRRILVPYLVASVLAFATGVATSSSAYDFAFRLGTGSMLGHYYFIPVLAACFLLVPLLARVSDRGLAFASVGLIAGSVALWTRPEWRVGGIFWAVRDPILQFHFGYFILGTLAGRRAGGLHDPLAEHPYLGGILFACVTAACVWIGTWHSALAIYPLSRITLTAAVIAAIAACTAHRRPPPLVRFLSEASLTIYLYHWFAYAVLAERIAPPSLALHLLMVVPVGLAFGSLVAVVGRQALGARSRLLIGY